MGWMDGLYADLLVLCSHIKRSFLFERPIRFFCLAVLLHALLSLGAYAWTQHLSASLEHYNDHLGTPRYLAPRVRRPVVSL